MTVQTLLDFAEEMKQMCEDYSGRDGSVYVGDVRARIDSLLQLTLVAPPEPYPGQKWKCGDEFLPFHWQASHVPAEYRDGWNACYRAARQRAAVGTNPPQATPDDAEKGAM